MKLLKIALLLASLPFLAVGGAGLYDAARDRQQTAVTCDQFVHQPPAARWLRVIGCDIDYLGAGYRQSRGSIAELFFPMRSPSQPRSSPVSLVVSTRDPDVLALAQQTLGADQPPEQEAYLVMMLRIVTMLRAAKEVDGYARAGILARLQNQRDLAGLSAPLAPGVVLLDLHARPSFLAPAVTAGAGLMLLLIAFALPLRGRRSLPAPVAAPVAIEPEPAPVAVAEPQPTAQSGAEWMAPTLFDAGGAGAESIATATPPPRPPAVSRAVLERRLPALMLLNLDASASAAELEYAPPLGSRQEVTARISAIIGPLTEDGGRYIGSGADWSLGFDLGAEQAEQHVWTATVDARGSDQAIDSLEKLVRETGWRLFVPKLGEFVETAALRTLHLGNVRS